MASNRKQPFGYRMELGSVIRHPIEHPEVQCIYAGYRQGASLKKLADAMQEKGIPYDEGKRWNKNMIARILADPRYTGRDGYPQIITEAEFAAAAERRESSKAPCQRSDIQKQLRRICTMDVTPEVESSVARYLRYLIHNPMAIQAPRPVKKKHTAVPNLEETVDEMLSAMPVDEHLARQAIFQLASARYEAIGNEEYETLRLRRVFQSIEQGSEPDGELLRKTVASVTASEYGGIRVRLKNNQVMEAVDDHF